MASPNLTEAARKENATTLMSMLGIDESEASALLSVSVCVTANLGDSIERLVAEEVVALLSRTVESASTNLPGLDTNAELVIGTNKARTAGPHIFLEIGTTGSTLSKTRFATSSTYPVPRIVGLLIACYASGALLQIATKADLPIGLPDPFVFEYSQLGLPMDFFAQRVNLERAYLVGAGAIGNGFLWAARYLNFEGSVEVVDDDTVSSGNLNRQIWFEHADIGKSKAICLTEKAQPEFPNLSLTPRVSRLQDLSEKSEGPWLRRMIVAVDSRRARRKLQNEFPGEVFDASTTDIREIVLHYHRQPTEHACLSCIYEQDQAEVSREEHIALHLGVSVEEVCSERVTSASASAIAPRFNLAKNDIEGLAYDSLFKSLCATGQLGLITDKRTIASFSFVSVLAGTVLAIEVARRLGTNSVQADFNYWRLSPWHPPQARRRMLLPKQPNCEFCGEQILRTVNLSLWGRQDLSPD